MSVCVVIEDFEMQGCAFSHTGAFSCGCSPSWSLVQGLTIPVVVGVSLVVVVGGVAITDYVIRVMQHRPCMCWYNAICSAGNTHLPIM